MWSEQQAQTVDFKLKEYDLFLLFECGSNGTTFTRCRLLGFLTGSWGIDNITSKYI